VTIRRYNPKNVTITYAGIRFEGFMDGTFIQVDRDLSRYPRECPRCGAPAYIGASIVDCSRSCS
jgi:hypothetical protein